MPHRGYRFVVINNPENQVAPSGLSNNMYGFAQFNRYILIMQEV
jgi:hypothetical protein